MALPPPPNNDKMTPGETVSLTPGPDPKERIQATSGSPIVDASEVIDDDYFKRLPLNEKHKVLMMDPHYSKVMSPKQQADFLNLVHYGEGGTEYERKERDKAATAKGVVKNVSYALPMVGGIAGAATGSAVPVFGTVAGGGLGTAAGESARQAIMHGLFPEEPSSTSREGLEQDVIWGSLGAASELPGAFARGYGRSIISKIAEAKSPKEVGDAIQAFNDAHPFGLTQRGLREGLEGAKQKLSAQLSPIYKMATGTSDIDTVLQPIYHQAQVEDVAFARSRTTASGKIVNTATNRVSNAVSDIIEAAKSRAGIKGTTATAQQLANFQMEIKNLAFESARSNPTVGGVAQKLMRDAYTAVGGEVDRLAPPARPILDRMTDIHAALSGLKHYQPGAIKSVVVTAATHPTTARVVSPAVVPAAVAGGREVYKGARALGEMIP
jgi:hypothetical protein